MCSFHHIILSLFMSYDLTYALNKCVRYIIFNIFWNKQNTPTFGVKVSKFYIPGYITFARDSQIVLSLSQMTHHTTREIKKNK